MYALQEYGSKVNKEQVPSGKYRCNKEIEVSCDNVLVHVKLLKIMHSYCQRQGRWAFLQNL